MGLGGIIISISDNEIDVQWDQILDQGHTKL